MTRGLSTAEVAYLRRAHERANTAERELADTLRDELGFVPSGQGADEAQARRRKLVDELVNAARDVGAGEVLLEVER